MDAFGSEALSGIDGAEDGDEGVEDPHYQHLTPHRITVDLSNKIIFIVKVTRSSLPSPSISTTTSTTTSAPVTP
ncbi:hypothetical protein CsSME_00014975 [Camellia sinensis var. sinensis]